VKKYLAIIPARGGSKSIKNKNLLKINGQSLLEIGIKKLKKINAISEVIVSSDSHEILNEAKKFGAIGLKRPKSLSNDNVSSELAIQHSIEFYQNIFSEENIVFHQCTSPLLSADSIIKAIKLFENTYSSCVFTVQAESNPIWLLSSKSNDYQILHKDDLIRKSRQVRKQNYIETGGVYIIDRSSFNKTSNRFGENPIPIVIPKIESLDIDDENDFIIAKKLI